MLAIQGLRQASEVVRACLQVKRQSNQEKPFIAVSKNNKEWRMMQLNIEKWVDA
jgi:hypothetical protein